MEFHNLKSLFISISNITYNIYSTVYNSDENQKIWYLNNKTHKLYYDIGEDVNV